MGGALNLAGLTGLSAGSNSFAGAIATFTTPYTANVADDFTANIDWGDGSSSAGTINGLAGSFTVSGSHLYAAPGEMTAVVDICDKAPGTAAGSASATIDVGDTPNRKYVAAVYQDVLGRAPDANGLGYWSQQLDHRTSIIRVAESIAHSAEYYANFVIKPDFLKLLGRQADDAGVTYWTQQMQHGLTDQELEARLIASDEFYAKAENFDPAPDADDTSIADTDRITDWIDAIYKLLLGRTPDSGGEKYWSSQLDAGLSREEVALRIANSSENNTQLIKADFFQYLGRAPDPDGLKYWLGKFASGTANEDVIAGITGSTEFYKKYTS
jgi:hypothetical protein